MILRIRLFAILRDVVESETLDVEIDSPCTIAQVRQKMWEIQPSLGSVLPHCLFAVDDDYAGDETVLCSSDSIVACIPPVSGG